MSLHPSFPPSFAFLNLSHPISLSYLALVQSLLAQSPLVHSAAEQSAANGESMPSVSLSVFILFSTAKEHFQQAHHT